MCRMLVISDIHGEASKFTELLKKAQYDPAQDQLILLGDYIDRGPDSKAVIEKVIQLTEEGAIALKGNHEDYMIKVAEKDGSVVEKWLRNGGKQTLQSYGYAVDEKSSEEVVALLQTGKIKEHIDFLKNLPCYYEKDDYIFVHGGVDPNTPLESTDPNVLMWIRDEFHQGYKGEKTVVFGHTPTMKLHGCYDVYFGENRIIGIDGGCVYGGRLNCLVLPSRKVFYIE
ncbi:metallophosphoesterase family protein [Thermoflavimicrobium dichotomicum]|uniref:Serine/threonine protein phosphatase 1 n=1 Tax=Thermoflavimicrobium dichotomicum TaxID=46223 RepID=A0A1I3NYE0_9BACL|nr:metallophosphoesterase family protein [Thermoflavimicrobium dichotomicum]SFJ14305.1 serine/threonine protein phosphatase 1 [Thermoflavimicrobium dichotomicum]